tara:strand:- start:8963 stop:9319 length:357 start_codon:yes stop_codon:yes gene_type:complete
MTYTIKKKDSQQPIIKSARLADTFFLRLLGLMFRKSIRQDQALVFYNAPSIHMFFMRFPLDILFLDKESKIIRICHSLKPWKMVFTPGARTTIEMASKKAAENSLKAGDVLELTPNPS